MSCSGGVSATDRRTSGPADFAIRPRMLYAICSRVRANAKPFAWPAPNALHSRRTHTHARTRVQLSTSDGTRSTRTAIRICAPQMIMFKARGEIDCATHPCVCARTDRPRSTPFEHKTTFVCVKSIHLYTLTNTHVRARAWRGLHQHHINPASTPGRTSAPLRLIRPTHARRQHKPIRQTY